MADNATAEVEDVIEDDGVSLEDMDASFDDTEDDSDEAEVETPDPEEEADTDDESEDEDEAEPETDEVEKEAEEVQESDEDKTKARNKQQAEARINAKQEREASLKQQQQDYLAEADPEDSRDLAVRELQIDAYNNKVEGFTNKLTNSYEKAMKDFDILSDTSPEIQAEVNNALDAFQAMHVKVDAYGNPIEVRGDLYAYLQTKADSITALTGKGARQQLKSKDKERSKTLATPSRAPKTPKADPDLDGFDEEANRW